MKLCEAIEILTSAGVPSPRYDARELFIRIGKMNPLELISPNTECFSEELCTAIERRKKREPLQYIIGEVDFYRESYKVTPDCLIPRQDTEILVDYAVKHIPSGAHFIDLCTGSGCVAISTLKNTSDTSALAVDISDSALSLARYNADKNGVSERISFASADVLDKPICDKVFAVLSNPPYVTEEAYQSLDPEIYFEPKIAFVGGKSGTAFYERIIELYKDIISESGFIGFEIGYDQADALRALADSSKMTCEIIKDYSQNDRLAILKKK